MLHIQVKKLMSFTFRPLFFFYILLFFSDSFAYFKIFSDDDLDLKLNTDINQETRSKQSNEIELGPEISETNAPNPIRKNNALMSGSFESDSNSTLMSLAAENSNTTDTSLENQANNSNIQSTESLDAVISLELEGIEKTPLVSQDFFSRYKKSMKLARCNGIGTNQSLRILRADKRAIAVQFRNALPMLEYVLSELEAREMPSEWVFLPMIESGYRFVEANGSAPVGTWQIVPITGRGMGLEMDEERDARLNPIDSTDAALRLILALRRSFPDDWRLVDMAYNAGEFRVRNAIAANRSRDPSRLRLSATTYNHWSRLNAWSCLARNSKALGWKRDSIMLEDVWRDIQFDFDSDRELLRVLSEDHPLFDQLNPASAGKRRSWLVPLATKSRIQNIIAQLGASAGSSWEVVGTSNGSTNRQLFSSDETKSKFIRVEKDEFNNNIVVVGNQYLRISPALKDDAIKEASEFQDSLHIVSSGENLWLIARKYKISLLSLIRWNELNAKSILRPGQVIRLQPKKTN